jgi:hypothetical protein
MKLVSFYCDTSGENFYSDCAVVFENKCKELNIGCIIKKENFGSTWIENVRAKPMFLLNMLNELKEDFMWLDIDCGIHKKIDFVVREDWMVDLRNDSSPHDYVHGIKYNDKSISFIKQWVKQISKNNKGSHSAFIDIQHLLKLEKIPNGYVSLGLSKTTSKKDYANITRDLS